MPTELKRNGMKLSRGLWNNVVNSISELIAYHDREMRVIWVNKAAAESVGKRTEELVGKHCYEIWPERKKPCEGCPVEKTFESGEQEKGKITTPDGRAWMINSYPVKNEKGSITGAIEITQEITAREETADKIKTSEERYRNLIELAPDGIISVDLQGIVKSCNLEFVKMTGYPKDEIIGKHFTKLPTIRKRDTPKYVKVVSSIIRGKTPEPFEFEWVRKDGSVRTGEIRIGMMKTGDKLTGMQAFIRDITDQKKVREKVRESEKRFRMLFEYAPDAYYLNDMKGKFVDGNRAAEKITGYKRQEIVGKTFADIDMLPKKQLPRAASLLAKNALGKPTGPDAFTLIRKDGKRTEVEISTYPVKIGGRTLVLGIARDITRKKEAEMLRKESEEKFRSLFEKMPDAVVVLDRKGVLLEASEEAEKLSGYRRDDLKGKSILRTPILDANNKALMVKNLALSFAKGKVPKFDLEIRRKDGKKVPLEVNAHLIDYMGKKADMVILRDISDREEAEKAVKESEKRLHDILMSSADFIWEIGTDGKYTFASGKVKDILGYEPKEILGKTPFDFMEKKEAERIGKLFHDIVSQKKPIVDMENWNLRKDGRIICLLTNGVPILDGRDKLKGYRGVDKDITERKRKEEELKKRTEESEKFSKLSVGRELRMIELKKRIKQLEGKLKEHGIDVNVEEGDET